MIFFRLRHCRAFHCPVGDQRAVVRYGAALATSDLEIDGAKNVIKVQFSTPYPHSVRPAQSLEVSISLLTGKVWRNFLILTAYPIDKSPKGELPLRDLRSGIRRIAPKPW